MLEDTEKWSGAGGLGSYSDSVTRWWTVWTRCLFCSGVELGRWSSSHHVLTLAHLEMTTTGCQNEELECLRRLSPYMGTCDILLF